MPQQTKSRGGSTMSPSRNRPKAIGAGRIRESDLADLRVDELRAQLRNRGVTGTSTLRKGDLVKALARAMRTAARGQSAARPKAGTPAARRNGTAAARKSTAPARKSTAAARKSTAPARKSTGGARTGASSSRSLTYAQRISGPEQRPERPGRSLVTADRQVIRRWAQARGGTPATVGSERQGRPSVLRIDFPGYGGANLRQITWDEWFNTFDQRRLNFIYQEQRTNGQPSNFFRLESPNREDA